MPPALKKEGKRAIYIGVENGYAIGRDLLLLDTYYDRGARYMTLCHTRNNDICDSANDREEHSGLSAFGEQVVERMNRLGMMVDISHLSEKAASQAIRSSKVPVLASHSNARAICDNVRNMSDTLITLLAEYGGVVQVCILSGYVRPDVPTPELDSVLREIRGRYPEPKEMTPEDQIRERAEIFEARNQYETPFLATVSEAVDHIDHIVKLVGIDHVGIGTDFDGGARLADCNTAADLPQITLELMRRGYTRSDLEKIWSGNLLRVMQQAQDYAAKP